MYEKHFGFSEKPFELSPNTKFFFQTTGHQSTLEALLAGIKDRIGWMVLSGEVGTGKTMLIYGLLARIPEKVKTAFIFHSTFKFRELLPQILGEVGEPASRGNLEQQKNQFVAYLQRLRDRGEVLTVLIDEAQKLTPEVVQELISLMDDKPWVAKHLQLILVGQPELDVTLNTLILKYHSRKPGLQITIYPLTRQDSVDYIEHRLRVVGSSSARIFSPEAISVLTEYARGIPRVINILCDNALLAGYSDGLQKIGTQIIWKVLENLEGPGFKAKKRFKSRKEGHSPRRPLWGSWRPWVIVVFIILSGIGLWLLSGEVKERSTSSGKGTEAQRTPIGKPEAKGGVTKPSTGDIPSPKEPEDKAGAAAAPPAGGREEWNAGDRPSTPGRRIQVKKGDSLSKISGKYYRSYNASFIDLIMHFNPSIKEVDLILENQEIIIPEIREENFVSANPDHTFRILIGTFFSSAQGVVFKREPSLKGKNIVLQPRKGSGNQTWTRVEAGNFGTREEALAALKILRSKKLLPFF